ncbi:MAG: iron ABC transporter permease [Chloroflexota bacterium]|nr:iron ABC transporter permease [Chloroflexota bacterium]
MSLGQSTTVQHESEGVRVAPHSLRPPMFLLLLAAVVVVGMLLPIAYLLLRAVAADAGIVQQVLRPRTLIVLGSTAGLALSVTTTCVLLGVPLAWITIASDMPGRRVFRVLTALPLVIPTYIGGYAIVSAFGPRGALQVVLGRLFGIEHLPELYGFWGAWLALTLFSYPYVLLSVQTGLRGLDPALEEAARSLGFGPWRTFWRVTLPQLRPSIAAGGLLVALYTLSDFGAVSLLQFNSFSRAIYIQYRGAFDRDYAAALALVLVFLTGLVLGAEIWSRGRARYHRSTVGVVKPRRRASLGFWRWPAVVLCSSVVLIALVMPVGVVSFWLARELQAGEPQRLVWSAAWNSMYSSAIAAGLAVAAALPVAILGVRFRSRWTAMFEGLAYAGYALPGIVIALALVRFASHYVPWLYQTLGLMVFAYVVRFMPQALGTVRSALLSVSPNVEEAARSLGHSPLHVTLRVTLPLIRSGLLSGAALVFLTAMKELPTTLLLGPIGFRTLATTTWTATAEGFFARAAGPALLIIIVSAFSMVFVLRDAWSDSR